MARPPSPCAMARVPQDQPETRTLLTSADQARIGVKVSFFGGPTIGRVASPHDLLASKLKELLRRAERKDSACFSGCWRAAMTASTARPWPRLKRATTQAARLVELCAGDFQAETCSARARCRHLAGEVRPQDTC